MRSTARSILSALSLSALTLVLACGDDGTSPPQPASVSAVAAPVASAAVGATLTAPITAVVRDAGGTPLEGVSVSFSVTSGGGSVSPVTTTTNASGQAAASWTLGTTPGAQTAQASVSGVNAPATFSTTATAGNPSIITIAAGNAQSAAAGDTVGVAPAVLLEDAFGNPVPGVSVFFTVSAGGGSVVGAGATTNADGIARVGSWRLGSTVGANRLTALAVFNGVTGNPIEFSATAVSGAAAALSATTSTSITSVVGASVAPLPSVRVADAAGNPVSGVQVTFTGSAGSTVTGAVKLSDNLGVATVDSWTMGTVARQYTLSASATGVASAVVFTATAAAGAPATVAVFAGNAQSATIGRPVAIEPAVRVLDSFNNPLAGIQVEFTVTGGGGFALARSPVTNASGVAAVGGWTLGDTPGINTLRATVTGTAIAGNPITFQATATPGTPSAMSIQAGNGQTAAAGTAVAVAPAVSVRDNRGNPVSGVVVQFLIGTGAGTLTGADAITDVAGVATVGSWTLGNVAGGQTLIARISGVPDVTFTATATAGTATQAVAVTATNLGNVVVNTLVSTPPSVRVSDALGNPVAGAEVTFRQVVTSDTTGVLTDSVRITDAAGIATLGSWRVGEAASNLATSVKAFVTGVDLAGAEPTFTVTKVAGAAAVIAPAAGSLQVQAAVAGAAVANIPAVRVTDAFGNAVAGVEVTFTPDPGNGDVLGSPVTSDANGIARITSWTMPALSGARVLTASIAGSAIPVVVFTANVP